ncbi:ankyrin repeat domain-containing protein, partial [Myxococcota bacterium]|nr:ankyrin repeat domain-containing protein [Myxococcota bacterium]
RTPLMEAALRDYSKNRKGIRLLLEAGAEINAQTKSEATALNWATGFWGNEKSAKVLTDNGAKLGTRKRRTKS